MHGIDKAVILKDDFINIAHTFKPLWSPKYKKCDFRFLSDRIDLINYLPSVRDLEILFGDRLTLATIYEDLEAKDHGLCSSLILLHLLEARKTIIEHCSIMDNFKLKIREVNPYCDISRFKESIWAISIHNLEKDNFNGRRLIFNQDYPILFLLLISDGLQCWDRIYYADNLPCTPSTGSNIPLIKVI